MRKVLKNIVRASEVIGKNIIGVDKEKLGVIYELVLDKYSGKIRYVVLVYGGFMGIGSEFYAVPWSSLTYCTFDETFKVGFSKVNIKGAAGFTKETWPDFSDPEWGKLTNEFYNHFTHSKS